MKINQTSPNISVTKDWLTDIKRGTLVHMIARAEKQLNPEHYELSPEAKKRLKWLYVLYFEENGNVTVASKKIGLSRPWLSHLRGLPQINSPSCFHFSAIFVFFSIANLSPYLDTYQDLLNRKNQILRKNETNLGEFICGRALNEKSVYFSDYSPFV